MGASRSEVLAWERGNDGGMCIRVACGTRACKLITKQCQDQIGMSPVLSRLHGSRGDHVTAARSLAPAKVCYNICHSEMRAVFGGTT